MPKRNFTVAEIEEYTLDPIHEEGMGQRRWSEAYRIIFQAPDDGKLYEVYKDRGLTECQETEWLNVWVADNDPERTPKISCAEVHEDSEIVVKTTYPVVTDGR